MTSSQYGLKSPTHDTSPRLILIRGLPGMGKSTLASILYHWYLMEVNTDVVQFSRDDYIAEYAPAKLKEADDECFADSLMFLEKGYTVIVHNIFNTMKSMGRYLEEAKRLGVRVWILEAIGQWESHNSIPEDVVYKIRQRWEHIL